MKSYLFKIPIDQYENFLVEEFVAQYGGWEESY